VRKVNKGIFQDHETATRDYDIMDTPMIGARIAVNNEINQQAKTRALEYYITDENGKNIMIEDATILEKISANLKYMVKPNKKKVVGYRSECGSDLKRPGFRLGLKWDEKEKSWQQDEEYYRKNVSAKQLEEKEEEII